MGSLVTGNAAEAREDECGCDDSGAEDKEACTEKLTSVWLHRDGAG